MTRKRRVRRRRRTQKGKAKPKQKGGKPLRINPPICKGLPSLVNGLEYGSIQTEKYVKTHTQTDYKAFFDGTCYPPYVVSTTHMSGYTLKGSFILMKKPEEVSMVLDKWMKWIQPISKEMFSSSLVGIRSNINPFKSYYDQLQLYKTALENKKSMFVKAVTSDSEILVSEENIKSTLQMIKMKYDYYNDIPFNMKEFLGFEKMSGWFGTEAARIKGMQEMDAEVDKLKGDATPYDSAKVLADIKEENEKKKAASKAILVLTTYVFCYLNRATDIGSLEKILGVLNKLYEQINSFSDVKDKGTPEDSMGLIKGFVEKFPEHLKELKTAMGSQRGGMLKGFGKKTSELAQKVGTKATKAVHTGATYIAEHTKQNEHIGQDGKLEPIKYYVKGEPGPTVNQPVRLDNSKLPSKQIGQAELKQSRVNVIGNSETSMTEEQLEELFKQQQSDNTVEPKPPGATSEKTNMGVVPPATTPVPVSTTENPLVPGAASASKLAVTNSKNTLVPVVPSVTPVVKIVPKLEFGAPAATIENSNAPSDGYIYEQSIHHLYQPMIQDPLKEFYNKIKKTDVTKLTIEVLYDLLKNVLLKGGDDITFDKLEAYIQNPKNPVAESKDEAVTDAMAEEKAGTKGEAVADAKADAKTGVVSEEKTGAKGEAAPDATADSKAESKGQRMTGGATPSLDDLFRAKLHFFMYPLYVLMKQLQKDIGHKEKSEIERSSYTKKDVKNNRLSDFKEYIKETIRSQPLVSFYPSGLKSVPPSDANTYRFVRLYNSYEFNYAKKMFNLNKIALENKFVNTAYLNGHAFVFVEDPAFFSGYKAYYYDTDDFTNGTTFEKPEMETKPKFSIFGESKEPVAKPAYAIPGQESTGLATTALNSVTGLATKVPMTEFSKGLLAAGKQTVENTAFLGKEAGKAIGTGISGAGTRVSSTYESRGDYGMEKFVADTNPFDTKEKRLEKAAAKIEKEQAEAKQKGGRVTRGEALGKIFTTNPLPAISSGARGDGDAIKYAVEKALGAADYIKTKSGNLIRGVFSLGWVPFELLVRLAIIPVILTGLSMKSVAGYFSDKLDKNSYLNLNKIANEKASECEKIAELLRMNWVHVEHTRTQQNVLQVLSNLYANVEYIEQQEVAFRDLHEYDIEIFKKMVDQLVLRVADPLFEKGKLYPLLKDTKKMTYVVYQMLQQCAPKKLSDKRSELLGVKKSPTSELDIKLEGLQKQLAEEKARVAKAKDKTESDNKIAQLEADIADLKGKKGEFDTLEKDLKEEPAALDANDKIIKEMLKKAPTITFKPDDMDAINNLFNNATPVVSKRYSSGVNRPLTERFDLMPEVPILAPKNANAPAIASLFVYGTGVDPDQAEKNLAAEKKQKRRDADKAASDTRMLEMSKLRSSERMKQQEERTKIQKERLIQTGATQRAQLDSETKLKLKDKEIANKLIEIQANHKAAVETSRLQQKREMKKLSAEIAEAKRKDTAESKREVLRLEADKKRSEAQYRGELNKLKTELIASIEKIKPGEGQKEAAAMDLGTSDIGTSDAGTSDSGTSDSGTTVIAPNTTKANMTKNSTKTNTTKTTTNTNTTGKNLTRKSMACVKHNERKTCYDVIQKRMKNGTDDISIEPVKK
jgi:hypothetical protein